MAVGACLSRAIGRGQPDLRVQNARASTLGSVKPSRWRPMRAATCNLRAREMRLRCVRVPDELAEYVHSSFGRGGIDLTSDVGLHGLKADVTLQPDPVALAAGVRLTKHVVAELAGALTGRSVLELGAVTGLPGIGAAALGAHVTMAGAAEALGVCQTNVDLNSGLLVRSSGSTDLAVLDWAHTSSLLQGPWDYVLGCDVVTGAEFAKPVALLLSQLLQQNPQAQVVFIHVDRGQELERKIFDTFSGAGLHVRVVDKGGNPQATILQIMKA